MINAASDVIQTENRLKINGFLPIDMKGAYTYITASRCKSISDG